jgi:hypothetical protein
MTSVLIVHILHRYGHIRADHFAAHAAGTVIGIGCLGGKVPFGVSVFRGRQNAAFALADTQAAAFTVLLINNDSLQ